MTTTASYEPDPEVIADLVLRASSERDPTRTRGEAVYSWAPPKSVGVWACRNPRCRAFAEVHQENLDALEVFNRQLTSKGEPPLDVTKILYCDGCLAEFKRTAPDRRRGQVERMAVAIRALKESNDPERERELLDNLEKWGHGDVPGLVAAIREKRGQTNGKRRSL